MTESASTQPVRVRTVHLDAEFASLADDWEGLQKDARSTSVFQSYDWQSLWWTSYGRGQPLRLLLNVLQKLRNPPMKAA
jgi:CelD/BcsL family acetyltransferase involved in cellulose biosynthesis